LKVLDAVQGIEAPDAVEPQVALTHEEVEPCGGRAPGLGRDYTLDLGGSGLGGPEVVVPGDLQIARESSEVQRLPGDARAEQGEVPGLADTGGQRDLGVFVLEGEENVAVGQARTVDGVGKQLVTAPERLADGESPDLTYERVCHRLFDEPPVPGSPGADGNVGPGSEEPGKLEGGAQIATLPSVPVEHAPEDAIARQVLLRERHPLHLEPFVERDAHVDPRGPFVLGVDHHVLASVGLGYGEDVRAGYEAVSTEDPARLFHQERVVAVTHREEQLPPNEARPGLDVEGVGQLVDLPQQPGAAQLFHVEDGVVVDEDVGDPAGGAGLGRGGAALSRRRR
jgi:hypothetical protein